MDLSPLKELGVSLIRTALVPGLAALVLQWLLGRGITFVPEKFVFTGVTFIIMTLWYFLFRGIELLAKNPKFKRIAGFLLGFPRFVNPNA